MHRSGELNARGRRTNRPKEVAKRASRSSRPLIRASAGGRAARRATLVLQPAAGRAAQRNFERTVRNAWTVRALERLGGVASSTIEAFRRIHRDQPFGVWATTRGGTNLTTSKFERVGRGDVVAFLAKGSRVFYSGRIGATVHDLQLGDKLGWERPPSKLPYEHIYTITHGRPVNIDARAARVGSEQWCGLGLHGEGSTAIDPPRATRPHRAGGGRRPGSAGRCAARRA
jgi:hypothetical protein